MILLNLDPIKGDSNIDAHTGWIALESFDFGVEREFSESAKTGSSDINVGVGDMQPISLAKSFDQASPDLMYAAMSGMVIPKAQIDFIEVIRENNTDENFVYCTYKLERVVVKKWSQSGGADERPNENLELFYYKCAMTYWQRGASGTKSYGPKGWDRQNSKAWNEK